MISLWAIVSEKDVESYVGTLLLPAYLSHLRLGPFTFIAQAANRDGREPLEVTYVGEGRVEEFTLPPSEHALAMIRFVCPGIDADRVQLPQDDASWYWSVHGDPMEEMKIYLAPTTEALNASIGRPVAQEAYVSVSRGHVFLGRAVVEAYIRAWLGRMGVAAEEVSFNFGTPSAGAAFRAGCIGGELCLDDEVTARDLLRFAGLERQLEYVHDYVELDLEAAADDSGIFEDGIYIQLVRREGAESEVPGG